MSLYYELDEKEIKDGCPPIGDIMLEVNNQLIKRYGISLNTLAINSLDDYCEMYYGMKSGQLQYVTEEILWKNLTEDEKALKIISYLKRPGETIEDLLIIDPYFFKQPNGAEKAEKYFELIKNILDEVKSKKITIITDKKNVTPSLKGRIQNHIEAQLIVKYSDDWHDRFWVVDREKGILIGTSLNGLGNKISSIQELSKEDVADILSIIEG
ncbi:hypothetical protein JTI58_01695 [Lysinibacillus fusiformis]|uniref:hypothetical protein n=1 Tax=Lysinibacillus fusiformis TaxID=28031 RepID=UPI0019680166|nr:hypothetical protein [Lysinibacillus fusiformis]QSB10456.1 hypothetical protein JTI58_01695 [Lysinibacillus fusiformis]